MQAQGTYAGGANRGNGFVGVRDCAYAEGLQILVGRKSIASPLTERQPEAIASNGPFEIPETAHCALLAN